MRIWRTFFFLFFLFLAAEAKSQTYPWLWASPSSGPGEEESWCIAADDSGNIYVGGFFHGNTATFGSITLTNAGAYDAFVVKYDSTGNVLWAKSYGGSGWDACLGVAVDHAQNVYLAGYFVSPAISFGSFTLTSSGNQDIFIVKLDPAGNEIWATNPTGSGGEVANDIAVDQSGGVVITGNFNSPSTTFGAYTVTNTNLYDEVFTAKYDTSGNALWAKSGNGSNEEESRSIATDTMGNIYITGSFNSTAIQFSPYSLTSFASGADNVFIVKYDAAGNVVWARCSSSGGSNYGWGVTTDPTGNVFVAGRYEYNSTLTFGSSTLFNTNSNTSDVFLVKYDPAGNLIWARSGNGFGDDHGFNLSSDANGHVYMTGGYTLDYPQQNTITFGSFTLYPYPGGNDDPMFIVKYDPNGNVECASALESGGDDNNDVIVNNAGNVYVAGDYMVNNFVIGGDTLHATNSQEKSFVAQYSCMCTLAVSVAGNDSICAGNAATLNASGGNNYTWSTGAHTAQISVIPAATTTYSVITTNGFCADTAYFTVQVLPLPPVTVSGAQSICIGDSATLIAAGGSSYVWSSGQTSDSITVNPAATSTYTVTASNGNCTDTAQITVTVHPYPAALITGDTLICPGTGTVLTASGGGSYLWNTGQTGATLFVDPATDTICSVVVSNGYCSASDSIEVYVLPPFTALASADDTIFIGTSTQLSVTPGTTYLWSPPDGLSCISCQSPVADPMSATTYTVLVTDAQGCTATDTVTVFVDDFCGDVFIPNAFSPDGDGQNDQLCVRGRCIKEMQLSIYDRWGTEVFHSNDVSQCWDGTYHGQALENAVFVYYLTATLVTGDQVKKQGNVSLVR